MPAASPAFPAPRNEALIRGRRLAVGVLVLMCAVFIASHFAGDSMTARLVRAMAEAGMIGGLADWFAVVALFRHPLGLPIPHTALLPKNQARAARNVARFFETHFLEPVSLEKRLRQMRPGRFLARWLTDPAHAGLVARELTRVLIRFLHHDPSRRILARSRGWLRALVRSGGDDRAISEALSQLVKSGVRGTAISEVLRLVRNAIDQNRDVAAKLVQDQSRWWIASAVDRRVADIAVDGVLSVLDELQDERSQLRRDFESGFDHMIDRLSSDGALERAIGEGRETLLRLGLLERAVFRMAEGLRDQLLARSGENPDALAGPIGELIHDFATRALSDEAMYNDLDAQISELGAQLIGELRPAIAGYVADIIASWEPEELIERFESEIGPDLQYIRVNGAALGALIGGLIFGLNQLIG